MILAKSSRIAAAEGLGAITIGRLAEELRMTKSGIFAHFGSKEKLQLETIGTARQLFYLEVMDPAQKPEGIARVWALCDLWLKHIESGAFPGGCFFTSTFFAHEGRSRELRGEIRAVLKEWFKLLKNALGESRSRNEIQPDADIEELAFELYS